MANFEALQRRNFRRSLLLVATLFVVLTALVYAVGTFIGGVSSGVLTTFAVVFSAGSSALGWWQSDRLVLAMTKAKIVEPEQAPQLHNVVEEVAIAAGLPKPRVALVNDPAPNAFATGRTPDRAVVAVTTGLLERMDRDELQAVVAHEMAHVANRDTLVMSVATTTAGTIALISDLVFRLIFLKSLKNRHKKDGAITLPPLILLTPLLLLAPFAASLLKAAISRSREGLADATAVEFTRNPSALRSALGKLAVDSTVVRQRSASVAHLWIESPLDLSVVMNRRYATHPPITDRIAALWRLEGGVGAPPPIPGYVEPRQEPPTKRKGMGLLASAVASGAPLLFLAARDTIDSGPRGLGLLLSLATLGQAGLAARRLRESDAHVFWIKIAQLLTVLAGLFLLPTLIDAVFFHG